MSWQIKNLDTGSIYNVAAPVLREVLEGMDTFEFTSPTLTLADNTLVEVYERDGWVTFRGFLQKSNDRSDDSNKFMVVQRATELNDMSVSLDGALNCTFTTATVGNINAMVDKILENSGWTRNPASSDLTELVDGISFYYTSKLEALFKLLKDELGYHVWFNDSGKVVSFGDQRFDKTSSPITQYIKVENSLDSVGKRYKRVGVIGASEAVFGAVTDPTYVEGDPVRYFQKPDIKSSAAALRVAGQLYDKLKNAVNRIVITIAYDRTYEVGDLIRFDGGDYIVYDVTHDDSKTVLGVGGESESINDILNNKITKPVGDGGGGGGIMELVNDTTPQLGGDLDCNGYNLTSVPEVIGASGNNVVLTCDTSGAFVFRKVSL